MSNRVTVNKSLPHGFLLFGLCFNKVRHCGKKSDMQYRKVLPKFIVLKIDCFCTAALISAFLPALLRRRAPAQPFLFEITPNIKPLQKTV